MKKNNKILILLILFCLFAVLVIQLTSPTSLYRDPWMFRHLGAAELVLKTGNYVLSDEFLVKFNFFGEDFFLNNNWFFYFIPVLSGVIFHFLSGLNIYFVFNSFYFLILILALSHFILFKKIFGRNRIALGLSLIFVLFPFEPLYYKISVHGWIFVRIFSAIAMYFFARFLQDFSFKSKNFLFLLFFSFLGIYSDKSAFVLVLLPVILFFLFYFFFERKKASSKTSLNYFFLVFLVLVVLSIFSVFYQLFWSFLGTLYNFLNFNFIPSFIKPSLPFSEFYLAKNFSYILIRYLIPFFAVFSLILLNFKKIKELALKNKIIKAFIFSQALFYFFAGFFSLFSFAFVSSRGASMLFLFFSLLAFLGLSQMKKSLLKFFLISFFFFFVLILPFLYFTQTPQFQYEQFNEKHVSSLDWVNENLSETAIVYSDVKMAKAVSLKTSLLGFNPKFEFGFVMENYIMPVYFTDDLNKVLFSFKEKGITHLLLTKEMNSLMVQPANELMKPATHLKKFDFSENFNKVFENKQAGIYEIKYN